MEIYESGTQFSGASTHCEVCIVLNQNEKWYRRSMMQIFCRLKLICCGRCPATSITSVWMLMGSQSCAGSCLLSVFTMQMSDIVRYVNSVGNFHGYLCRIWKQSSRYCFSQLSRITSLNKHFYCVCMECVSVWDSVSWTLLFQLEK
jgi:hypothetical protein